MHKITIVIPFNQDTAALAERLCDWIRELNQQSKHAHCLLVSESGTHDEMRDKVRLAAGMAFELVDEIIAAPFPETGPEKIVQSVNLSFRRAAEFVLKSYRWPWLWLEPESVPMNPEWLGSLMDVYDFQPRRYMGSHMKMRESIFMARTGIYPVGASLDLDKYCASSTQFEIVSASVIVPKCYKTKLIQQIAIQDESGYAKIRPDAVLVVGDPAGGLIEKMRSELNKPNPEWQTDTHEIVIGSPVPIQIGQSPRIDLRTRAGRALKAANMAGKE